eukprot:3939906-Rhodomonas_salina.3
MRASVACRECSPVLFGPLRTKPKMFCNRMWAVLAYTFSLERERSLCRLGIPTLRSVWMFATAGRAEPGVQVGCGSRRARGLARSVLRLLFFALLVCEVGG